LRLGDGSALMVLQAPRSPKRTSDQYLVNICYKAGEPLDAVLDSATKLYKLQALVFKEVEPNGKVTMLDLHNI